LGLIKTKKAANFIIHIGIVVLQALVIGIIATRTMAFKQIN
jgi:hypothetical protein